MNRQRDIARQVLVSVSILVVAACEGPPGAAGKDGANGASCSVADDGEGTKIITCADGTRATVDDGAPGTAGTACSVTSNADGTRTISCSDGTKATVSNGKDGATCTVAENGDGTRTISCSDGTSVTLNDGQNGSDGQNGTDGTNGTSCTVTAEPDGATLVACTDGTFTRVAPPINPRVDPEDDLPGLVLTILHVDGASHADGTFAAGDVPAVTFTLTTATGEAVPLDGLHTFEAWLSGPTSNYQHVIPSTRDQATLTDVAASAVQNEDGTLTYAFAQPIPSTYGVPLNDTTKFTDGELSGPLLAGTYTLAMNVAKTYAVGAENVDDVGSDVAQLLLNGATTVETREVVTTANCNQCHTKLEFHAGLYRNTTLCATCHTAGAEDNGSTDGGDATPVTIELKVMIHKLHDGAHLPSVLGIATNADGTRNYSATPTPYIVGGDEPKDFSEVGFPVVPSMTTAMPRRSGYSALSTAQRAQDDNMRKGVVACEKCHGVPDTVVAPAQVAVAPAQGANFSTQPSRRACQSCHDDVDFTKPYDANLREMPPEPNDNACTLCHTAAGSDLSIVDAHRHPQSLAGSPPNFFAITSVSGGSGGNGNFQTNDAPVITFTLKDGGGANLAPFALDAMTALFIGPTTNRQIVTPYPTPNGVSYSLVDFAGRLASASTTNKGIMSKIVAAGGASTTSETLFVQFTSSTAFTVTGKVSGVIGTGTLAAATSTNPSGSSISAIQLTGAAPAHPISVAFLSSTDFTVLDGGSSIGVGHFAASTNASTHFVSTDGSIAFNVAVGTTAFAPNNTIAFTIFSGASSSSSTGANPITFAIAAGRTAFAAGDRFYYDYLAPAASYTLHVPMELPLEPLGHADGSANPVLTAGNTPVDFGRQSLFERTALVGTATALTSPNSALDRFINVAALDAGLAVGDFVVLEDGTANEEYVQVGLIDAANKRVAMKTPLRFAHAAGATFQEATLTFRQEGSAYTLDAIAGTITLAATSTNAFVMTYRTDARFGWHRKAGDALQATYAPPMNDSPDLDETWGDWSGKSYVDGTYTVALYGNRNLDVGLHGEVQTYRAEEQAALADFLFGNATTVAPYQLVSSGNNCQACHSDLSFHGGSRRGPDVCFMCHGVSGAEDTPQYSSPTLATTGVTVNFRTMLHKIHRGSELAQAETYAIAGNGGSTTTFGEIEFPAMPGGVMNCTKCHGTSDVFRQPTDRNHPTQQGKPVRAYRATCGACHDADAAQAHIEQMTSSEGVESCETCHGIGREYAVDVVHKAR